MIDFRYHLVSLISVFLALAVGIALGAGPLKETIGDTLTGQVEVLRGERETLRADLADARTSLDQQSRFLDGAAPRLLDGTLTGRRVAVVSLGEVEEQVREAVEEQLTAAGASVSAQVQVTEGWTDPALETYREELAGNLRQYLDPAPEPGAGAPAALAEALAQALTGAAPTSPDALSEPAGLMLEMLTTGDSELVTVADPVTTPADAVVVLTADPTEPETEATPGPDDDADDGHLLLVAAVQDRSEGAVLAGSEATRDELLATVLDDGDLAAQISTVTGVAGVTGQVSVPLALNARIGGTVGHYGFGDGLTPVPEPVTLPAVDRAPTPATDPTTATDAGTEAAETTTEG